MKKLFVLLALSLVSATAYADWGLSGAAALCSSSKQSFELISTLETSGWGDIPAPPGAHAFSNGFAQKYRCKIGGDHILLVISVSPPGQGMGEGGGVITIDKLTVNKLVLLQNAYFNWSVSGEPEIISVEIKRNKRRLAERLCYASDISDPKSPRHCEMRQIDGSNYLVKRTQTR